MNPKEQALLDLLARDTAYENHFFRKVKDPKWFFALKDLGYFTPEKNPTPKPADKEGYYTVPQWNVLDYLEKLSLQPNLHPDNIVEELLKIITDVSQYKDSSGKIIDNYRTWWFFVKILLNLPNDKIPVSILEFIPIWLESRFGSSLVDADIASKLLPKFLNERASNQDIKKAELIFKYLTNFKWAKKKGVLTREEDEAEGVVTDHWLIEAFFEDGQARLAGRICSTDLIIDLANKLKEILKHQQRTNWLEIEVGDTVFRLSLDYTGNQYEAAVGTYHRKKPKDIIESFSVELKDVLKFELNPAETTDFLLGFKEKIEGLDLPADTKREVVEKLKRLNRSVFEDYSYIWLKDLRTPDKAHFYNFKQVLMATLIEALIGKVDADPLSVKAIINSFTSYEYPYLAFGRIALFVIGKYWSSYKDIFWQMLDSRKNEPLFEEPNFEIELRLLLKGNISKFTKDEKKKLESLIERGPEKYLVDGDKDKYVAYWKQRWYSALKEDPSFNYSSASIKRTFGDVSEEEVQDDEGFWIDKGNSPLSEEEIIKMSNTQLADYCLTFRPKDDLKAKRASSEGLAEALEKVASKNPEKFTSELTPFLTTGYFYIYHILNGLKQAWTNKLNIDWSTLLLFLERYLEQNDFWNDKLTSPSGFYDANHSWVIGSIGELIREGSKDDNWSIAQKNFPLAHKILRIIVKKSKPDKEKPEDFVGRALNTGLGKISIALIYFALLMARLEKKQNNEVKLDDDIRSDFKALMEKPILESYTVFGEYLINFFYLDSEWTKNQVLNIPQDDPAWEAFMSGYLSTSRVNLEVYKLMNAHYKKGLNYKFKEATLSNRLTDHIGVGFLNGEDAIGKEKLIDEIIKDWNIPKIQELVDFAYRQRESLLGDSKGKEEMIPSIIDLWQLIFNHYEEKKNLSYEDKDLLSDLSVLTVFLSEIDEEKYKWLILSAKYVEVGYHSPHFIEYLNKIKDSGEKVLTASRIADIYIEMLKTSKPTFESTNILSLIEHLYSIGNLEVTQKANKICNEYAKVGIEFLNELYKKHN